MSKNETKPVKPLLGERLKSLREARGLKLPELAEITGLSRSSLYKVENSGMSLTYDKLIDLADGLGVSISELFQKSENVEVKAVVTARREVGRKGEGYRLETKNYDYRYLCPDLKSKKLTPILGVIHSRSTDEFEQLFSHKGEEFNFVIDGAIDVHTEYYSPVRLEKGDYIYLDSTMPHAFVSVSEESAVVLSICTSVTGIILDGEDEAKTKTKTKQI